MINGIYTIVQPIKHGSFGSVFLGKNTISDEPVAIKVDISTDSIQHETTILQYLASKGCRVVPPVFNYGRLENGRNYLIMPYYESSLADYMHDGLSPEHAKEIIIAMFDVLKHVHRKWVVHRDIKPANFMVRSDGSLVLIDFGLATYYMDYAKTHVSLARHIPEQEPDQPFIGSRRYASINVHAGYTPSRRDDLISAGYIYVAARWPEYMRSLQPEHAYSLQPEHMRSLPIDWVEKKQLHNLPEESRPLFKYLYSLAFMESPDYSLPISIL
jgi:serine/threonine protein kinase